VAAAAFEPGDGAAFAVAFLNTWEVRAFADALAGPGGLLEEIAAGRWPRFGRCAADIEYFPPGSIRQVVGRPRAALHRLRSGAGS
jgi:hypothetical protein